MYSMWPLGRSSGGPQSTTSKEMGEAVLWGGGCSLVGYLSDTGEAPSVFSRTSKWRARWALCWPHSLHGTWH